MKKPLEQLEIRRQRGRLRGLFCQLSTISILLTPVLVRYCQPREDGSWVTGAPPQLRQGRPARCAGPRLGGTATTGPTPASPARHSSGGHTTLHFSPSTGHFQMCQETILPESEVRERSGMSDQLGHEEDMYGLQVDGMYSGRYEQTYNSGLCGVK